MDRREFTGGLAAVAGTSVMPTVGHGRPIQLSLSEISTINATFKQDVQAYKVAGFDAIGIWEFKLPNDDSVRETLHDAGLSVSNCVPAVPSILPWDLQGMEGPRDPAERIAKLCESMGRLAKYHPASVLVLSGPMGNYNPAAARRILVDGLDQVAKAAKAAGVRVGLEPISPLQRGSISFINSLADAIALLNDAHADDVGIMADTYNLWDEVPGDLAAIAHRVTGLHVADVPKEAGRTDRLLPGENGDRTAKLASALLGTGWSGYMDVEIFSTPQRFWALPVDEAAKRAYAAVSRVRKTVL